MSDAYQAIDVNAVDPRKDPLSAPAISPTPAKFPSRQPGLDMDKLIERQGKIDEEGLSMMRENMARNEAARRDLTAEQARYTKTAQGALETMRKGQKETPEFSQPDMSAAANNYMMFAAAMASIAGAFGRYHSTTAFNAFAGAMNGFAQGSMEAFNQNFQKWKAADTAAQRHNEKLQRDYQAIMESAKLNLDQKMTQMQMVAAANQDQMTYQLATQRNFTQISNLIFKREELLDKSEQSAAKLENMALQFQLKISEAQAKADKAGLNTLEGFTRFNNMVSQGLNSPDPQVRQKAEMMVFSFALMHPGAAGGTEPAERLKQIREILKQPNAASNPKNKGFFASLFGSSDEGEGEEIPGAPATPPAPAAPAAAGPTAPPVATPAAARPAAPPAAAAAPTGPTIRGVQPYQPPTAKMPQMDVLWLNRRDGRDGRSPQTAMRLRQGKWFEDQAALPDGTYYINPKDGRPLVKGQEGGDATAGQ